ncbi:hypothetical protein [Rhodopirellula sp. P2]|uniref:hypothetical protein n=1 Tax=Rhodopirellula sp. P2 TaxID=2127060 RepID=UPI0023684098|nr:hypothetical protein [Rhodopirellula sp. P2]WDQ14617.1 hypothetical protein PSR62_13285 [Rhodopirellula sp. P2]
MIGLPLTAPRPEKVGRFPCEACPCGCSSADYCWDKCCCHSDFEKLQWAAENNVTPPAFLVARVDLSLGEIADGTSQETPSTCASGSCCGPDSPGPPPGFAAKMRQRSLTCHSVTGRSAEASTGSLAKTETASCCGDACGDEPASPSTSEPVRWVRLQDAAKCHGIEMVWSLFSSVVVDFQAFEWKVSPPPLLFRLSLQDDHADAMSLCPEPPVP